MNPYPTYLCSSCESEHETKQEAQNCCPPATMWTCDECGENYDEKADAVNCCAEEEEEDDKE